MGLKIYGNKIANRETSYSLQSEMKMTCQQCKHAEIVKGALIGDVKCPACGGNDLVFETSAPQQEVK
ncbi:hypothetical protein ACOJRE_002468 [Enterobacter hormaechei]|uniref:hypothetical protein n=1 Tax=Enterobacter hormaechei TaxID=158836 RepID=UPI0028613728|nr:hypothetical protein [Enterobacter hormaechei]HCJ6256152.1 hypothetical protein [Enterobacter hormaechei subsp. xiangfangensis]ELD3228467.1 hypothetical protein [Enterobacter hormaechei]ELD3432540.1 hypothetical protein [Enterobacter hormaechei]MED5745112.1 hypothetical protein [Enterobacter hormaechei]HCJ6416002.1 hypothetical protein [Enterobacter hormaechei subsp. xiangfangensis]